MRTLSNEDRERLLAQLRKTTDDFNKQNPELAALSPSERIKMMGEQLRALDAKLENNETVRRLAQCATALEEALEALSPELRTHLDECVKEQMEMETEFRRDVIELVLRDASS